MSCGHSPGFSPLEDCPRGRYHGWCESLLLLLLLLLLQLKQANLCLLCKYECDLQ